jgi:concentrative nucleoside transporter, CNT family
VHGALRSLTRRDVRAFAVLEWRQLVHTCEASASPGRHGASRRSQIAQFGIRALIAGTLANLPSAAIAGMLIG